MFLILASERSAESDAQYSFEMKFENINIYKVYRISFKFWILSSKSYQITTFNLKHSVLTYVSSDEGSDGGGNSSSSNELGGTRASNVHSEALLGLDCRSPSINPLISISELIDVFTENILDELEIRVVVADSFFISVSCKSFNVRSWHTGTPPWSLYIWSFCWVGIPNFSEGSPFLVVWIRWVPFPDIAASTIVIKSTVLSFTFRIFFAESDSGKWAFSFLGSNEGNESKIFHLIFKIDYKT